MSLTKPKKPPEERTDDSVRTEPPWNVILHNSWHPMTWVIYTLKKTIPGITVKKATRLMWTAHTTGQVVVKSCHKELAELYEAQLQAKKLTASIERSD